MWETNWSTGLDTFQCVYKSYTCLKRLPIAKPQSLRSRIVYVLYNWDVSSNAVRSKAIRPAPLLPTENDPLGAKCLMLSYAVDDSCHNMSRWAAPSFSTPRPVDWAIIEIGFRQNLRIVVVRKSAIDKKILNQKLFQYRPGNRKSGESWFFFHNFHRENLIHFTDGKLVVNLIKWNRLGVMDRLLLVTNSQN